MNDDSTPLNPVLIIQWQGHILPRTAVSRAHTLLSPFVEQYILPHKRHMYGSCTSFTHLAHLAQCSHCSLSSPFECYAWLPCLTPTKWWHSELTARISSGNGSTREQSWRSTGTKKWAFSARGYTESARWSRKNAVRNASKLWSENSRSFVFDKIVLNSRTGGRFR